MGKYKICVYAISKNEEKFAKRWANSMKEADEIYVLDTGSTDNTVKVLKSMGVNVVQKIISPWRFDTARNLSLELVPKDADICVCTDLDEVFVTGWRKNLEKVWNSDITRVRYNYNWKLDENNKPVVNFYLDNIHSRNGYKWFHLVHEVLTGENEVYVTTDDITLNHYPDDKKSRASYLPLLEFSVKEDPSDDRNMHYLGREYMYRGMWNECITTLIKHLKLPKAKWKDERCASMRFIARSYLNLGRIDEARLWSEKAINEAPYLRDPYVERALIEYSVKNWDKVLYYSNLALKIRSHEKTYINEIFSWDYTLYDLLSLCYYELQEYEIALTCVNKALAISKNNDRLIKNKKIIEEKIREK